MIDHTCYDRVDKVIKRERGLMAFRGKMSPGSAYTDGVIALTEIITDRSGDINKLDDRQLTKLCAEICVFEPQVFERKTRNLKVVTKSSVKADTSETPKTKKSKRSAEKAKDAPPPAKRRGRPRLSKDKAPVEEPKAKRGRARRKNAKVDLDTEHPAEPPAPPEVPRNNPASNGTLRAPVDAPAAKPHSVPYCYQVSVCSLLQSALILIETSGMIQDPAVREDHRTINQVLDKFHARQ